MKRALLIACGLLPGLAARAFTVNFHDAAQGYTHYSGYNALYYGQGVISDSGNNVWNGFGQYPSSGGSFFYGLNNPNSGHGSVPNGLVGNPYAWTSLGGAASGNNLFNPTNPGAGNVGNANSASGLTPITLTLNYDFDAQTGNTVSQGNPNFLLAQSAAEVELGHVGTFSFANVPAGTYSVVLYGVNPAGGSQGAIFSLSSGTAVGGLNETTGTAGTPGSFVLGQTYVEYVNVTPDSGGNINGTWTADNGPTDEGFFNGVQLVQTPEPSTIALLGLSAAAIVALRRRKQASE